MLNAAEKFFAFYAALSAPVAPAGPAATERQTRFADDEDSTDAALFAAAAMAANRAAADVQGPATAGGGGLARQGSSTDGPHPVERPELSGSRATSRSTAWNSDADLMTERLLLARSWTPL